MDRMVSDDVLTQRLVHLVDEQKRNELMIIYIEDLAAMKLTAKDLAPGGRTAVAQAVLASPEAAGREVQDLFEGFLQRPAEPLAIDFFSAQMQAGVPVEMVLATIVGSPEYRARG